MDSLLSNTVRAKRRSLLVVATFVLTSLAASHSPAQQPKRPPFTEIARAVDDYFKSLKDYQQGDVITQSQINAALERVKDAGWDVPDAERIVKLGLADGSFLASQLATPEGRKFMRKIAHYPGGYTRLERLSSIARGERMVRDLIRERNGHKFIEYLATTRGGHNLGKMLAGARQGTDLNEPTGRIYTAADLLLELQRVYATTK